MMTSKNLFAKVSLFVFSIFITSLASASICFAQSAGELDPTFFPGRTITRINADSNENATATAIQADGKIVAAGQMSSGSTSYFAVARYNTDGTLDTSFANNGKAVTQVGTGESYANAVVIQPDGKIVLGGTSINSGSYDFTLVRYNLNGSLDNSFDGDGKVTTNINGYDSVNSLAIKSDKIIAAGSSSNGSVWDMAIARYNVSNGSLDNNFSGDGKMTFSIGAGDDFAQAVAVQLNDRIVVAGYSLNGTNKDFALARFNSDGTLDGTLNGGKITTPISNGDDVARAIAILPDNRIVVAGYSTSAAGGHDFAVARYSVFGSLDTSLDGDGKLTTDLNGWDDDASSIALQTDGKIVLAGETSVIAGGFYQFGVVRYNPDGALDNTFDADGKVNTTFGINSGDHAYGVAVQTDGRIVAAGYTLNGSNFDFAVARYNSDGTFDGTFGNRVFTAFGANRSEANSTAVQADGKIVVAGYSYNSNSNQDFALTRYNADGTLDSTFGTNGKVTTAFGSDLDIATAVAIQADGKIVVAGYTKIGAVTSFALARYNANGSPDTSFGANSTGRIAVAVGAGNSVADAMAIQTNGRIVLVGTADNNFAVVRFGPNGSPDTSFDGDGKVITAVGTDTAKAHDVLIQPDGKIVVGGEAKNGGNNNDFALVRYNSDGSLDSNFYNGGKALTEMGATNEILKSLAIQPDGKIIAAGETFLTWHSDVAVARFNTDGTLDTNFDGDGRVTTEFTASRNDRTGAVAIQPDGKIIVGGSTNVAFQSITDPAFARFNSDGSLDTSFDGTAMNPGDGKVVITLRNEDDKINDIALQPDGKIVAVGMATHNTIGDFAAIRLNGAPTINNNDAPKISISDVSKNEGNSGTTAFTFDVTLSAPAAFPASVAWTTSSGSATAGLDYTAASGTLNFAVGEAAKQITISVNGDTTSELSETFFINLSSPTNATIPDAQGTGTILDDDNPGMLQFAPAQYNVNENVGFVTVTVSRVNGTAGTVSVDYANANGGTATAGSDYSATSGTLVFQNGETSKTFSVTILDDQISEQTESINLVLSNPTGGAALGTSSAVINVVDNEPVPLAISGAVKYAITSANQPQKTVSGALIKLSGASSGSVATDEFGAYSIKNLTANEQYTVTAAKYGELYGVTAFDATLVLRHVAAGDAGTLTANQKLSADTNNDSTITAFDATQILRFVAANAQTAITGEVGNWKFVPQSHNYPALNNSMTGEDYEAILIGEVSGDWGIPNNLTDGTKSEQQETEQIIDKAEESSVIINAPLSIGAQNQKLELNEEVNKIGETNADSVIRDIQLSLPENVSAEIGSVVSIPVLLTKTDGKQISSYSFAVLFDPDVLQPEQGVIETNKSLSSNGFVIASDTNTRGRIGIASSSLTNVITSSGILLNLRFKVIGRAVKEAKTHTELSFESTAVSSDRFEDELGNTVTSATTNGSLTVIAAQHPSISVSGRVLTGSGSGIKNVLVRLVNEKGEIRTVTTSAFGYYRFADVPADQTYTISASGKKYNFTKPVQLFSSKGDAEDINFVADN